MQKKKIRISSKKFSKRANTDVQKRLEELHAQIRIELAGHTLPDPAEIVHQGREERSEQLLDSFRL